MAYAQNCVYGSGLKATGIFVILLGQDGFESNYPEIIFEIITAKVSLKN